MWKKWTALGFLAALLLAGCGGGVNQPPGDQLSAAEDSVNAQAATLLNDAIAAFNDVLPAGLAPQATGTEPPPLTLAYNGEETVLTGCPSTNVPCPRPLVSGVNDLNGKPLFITIKTRSGPRPPKAHVGRLQKNARGEWEVAWYGERGAPPEVLPATVEQTGQFTDTTGAKVIVKFSFIPPDKVDIIIIFCERCNTEDILSSPRIHVRAPLPQNLPGREISSGANPDMQGFASKLKDICCRKPKPFPPDWPPLILFRNDASVVVVPYDNPRVRDAQSPEDLLGQDIGFVYVRRIISGGTSTGYCGPNGVWCPPREEPFYNVRVIGDHRERQATFIQFTKLGNPSQVVATLPAEVAVEPSDGREIGIMDSIDSPNEPFLKIRWPKIKIKVRLISEMQR
jgi:outer membrane murein-binding lipoprotein Lpp